MYKISIKRRARKALTQLPDEDYQRVQRAIRGLATAPRPVGSKKLKEREAWRLRVGVYRVIYEIEDEQLLILVIDVRHRREAYR